MKTVSIAMGTYNGSAYILEQLESLARQTMLPAELVVTDDGSTDDTLEIIAGFAARNLFPIRIEKNTQRLGWRANFIKAAGLCQSDLIAFCDQDDVWLPTKLEACIAEFENNEDVLLTYHEATITTGALEPVGPLNNPAPQKVNPPLSVDSAKYGSGFTFVIHRMLTDFNALYQESSDFYDRKVREAHDQWYYFLASSLGTIVYISESQALYRRHDANTTSLDKKGGLMKKWQNLLATNLEGIASREMGARQRASIMARIAAMSAAPYKKRAIKAAEGFRLSAAHYKLRQDMYTSAGFLSRCSQCVKLLRIGGYKPRQEWGVGHKALLRDILCGVLFPTKA